MGQLARKRVQYPDHDYADNHVLLRAMDQYKPPTVRDAAKIRPSGEIACDQIRELGWDLGAEYNWERWMAAVAEKIGLHPDTARAIFNEERVSVTNRTVDKVHLKTGIPLAVLYGEADV